MDIDEVVIDISQKDRCEWLHRPTFYLFGERGAARADEKDSAEFQQTRRPGEERVRRSMGHE